jgi:hypothetical protein
VSQLIKKIYSLKDIIYAWLLVISKVLFGFSFYIDRINLNDPIWLLIIFFISFAIAILWGTVDYIGHIRMNAMYQKQNNIRAYVNQLAMSEEDKLELQTYL